MILLSSVIVIEQMSILSRSSLLLLASGINSLGNSVYMMVWVLAALELWSTVLCSADHFILFFYISGMAVEGSVEFIEPCFVLHCHVGLF